jgi:proliferating cell nuclear antigen
MSDDITFRAIAEAGTLQQFVDTYRAVCHEATVEITDGGLTSHPVDPSNVAMVEQTLSPRAFESYETFGDGGRLGLNLDRFADYLGKAGSGDMVELELNAETRKLSITLPEASFSMALIDPESIRDNADTPDDLEDGMLADVTMDAAALAHAVDVVEMVTDQATVAMDPDADAPLELRGEGDTDDAVVSFENSLHEGSTVDAEAETILSVDYLEELTAPMPDDADVRCRFGDEYPALFAYEWADGAGQVEMMLAPRINTH